MCRVWYTSLQYSKPIEAPRTENGKAGETRRHPGPSVDRNVNGSSFTSKASDRTVRMVAGLPKRADVTALAYHSTGFHFYK